MGNCSQTKPILSITPTFRSTLQLNVFIDGLRVQPLLVFPQTKQIELMAQKHHLLCVSKFHNSPSAPVSRITPLQQTLASILLSIWVVQLTLLYKFKLVLYSKDKLSQCPSRSMNLGNPQMGLFPPTSVFFPNPIISTFTLDSIFPPTPLFYPNPR